MKIKDDYFWRYNCKKCEEMIEIREGTSLAQEMVDAFISHHLHGRTTLQAFAMTLPERRRIITEIIVSE